MFTTCALMNISKPGGGVLIYFSVQGRAAEQGIIFTIPTPGQGIIIVKLGFMTGSILAFLTSKGRCRPFALCKCDSNNLDGNISTFSIDFVQIYLQCTINYEWTILFKESK